MNKKNDEEIFEIMDHLDIPLALKVMDKVELSEESTIDRESLARIKADTFTKLRLPLVMGTSGILMINEDKAQAFVRPVEEGESDRRFFQSLFGIKKRNGVIAAGLAIIVLAASFVASSPEVRAQIRKVIQFLPGFATVQDTQDRIVQFVLPDPVVINANAGQIEIRGVSIGDTESIATLTGPGLPSIKSFVLQNGKRNEYVFQSSSLSGAGAQWTGGFIYKGPIEVTENMRVSIEKQISSVPIRLTKAQQADQIKDLGVTDAHHGVSLTAVSRIVENGKTKVTLLPQVPAGMRIEAYGFSQYDYLDKPELKTSKGENVAIERDADFPNPNEFSFQRNKVESENYKLRIPTLTAILQPINLESFTVPIPVKGVVTINKPVSVNGYPVEITKVERVSANGLKIYFNMYYDSSAEESLRYFTPELKSYPNSNGYNFQVNEQTRAMEYMVVDFPPEAKEYKFFIKESHIVIRGPWEFQLH